MNRKKGMNEGKHAAFSNKTTPVLSQTFLQGGMLQRRISETSTTSIVKKEIPLKAAQNACMLQEQQLIHSIGVVVVLFNN